MSEHPPPEWLADSASFVRRLIEREGDQLIPVDRDDDAGAVAPVTRKKVAGKKEAPTFQTGKDIDPVGVPESMTCTIPDSPGDRGKLLGLLNDDISGCLRCSLGQTRTNFVFGTGDADADVMFIGEAPGHDEDIQGEPFVGRAGQLLNKIIESIGFVRQDVYIGNILKCRPPGNRDPLPGEVEGCEPYLRRQIAIVQPAVVCALGRIAAQTLLRSKLSLGKLRSEVHSYQGRPLLVTYHPAALLRNPHWKKPTWEDVKLLKKIHDEEVGV